METIAMENEVFRKLKEISLRSANPRPAINVADLSNELKTTHDALMPWLTQLKQLRLISFNEIHPVIIKLTLLGSVVKR